MFIRLLIRSHTFIFTGFKPPSQLKHTVLFWIIKSPKKVFLFHCLSKYMSLSREMFLSSLLNNPRSVTTQLPVSTVYIPPICCICLFFYLFFLTSPHTFLQCSLLDPRRVPRDKNISRFCKQILYMNSLKTLISAGLRHRRGSEMT